MIERYRGDTQKLKIKLSKNKVAVNLDDVTTVELGIDKGAILVLTCEKDVDATTGYVYAPFTETTLDTVGFYPFDVQVTWATGEKTTFLVDKFRVIDDVNKT